MKNFTGRPFFSLFFVARANQKIPNLALGREAWASLLTRSVGLVLGVTKSANHAIHLASQRTSTNPNPPLQPQSYTRRDSVDEKAFLGVNINFGHLGGNFFVVPDPV
jgi:hypothetical protein